jgi:hypothetical protein
MTASAWASAPQLDACPVSPSRFGAHLAVAHPLTEATLDLRQLLENLEHVHLRDRQIKAWPEPMLPRRVRELWKSRFPESPSASTA